ncbi:sodium:proton antiporter [Burkholderia ubonensis]|uniref:cation:proton antiporter n=1 Tax=Burkholderia ubonensis TaxID=101571 RepID=UPI00075E1AF2|nr:sodium:proton antiporter [Burkholderia ubonensis]KVP88930.1 sodium:proton antiporter [Burkholderia ubonensis]
MTLFQIVTVLIALTAFSGYLNHRLLHLPPTIGLMTIALACSLVLVILGETGVVEVHTYSRFVPGIDFSDLVFHGVLAFLLFAGALHVDLGDLRKVKWTVTVLSTLGTIISTFVIGALFWYAANLLGYELRFVFALLFGALISPTDPIAVLGIIKKAGAPKALETRITGESLFNDGVGAVVFLTILDIATGRGEPSVASVSWFFAKQTLGGIALGWLLGWIVFRLLRKIDDYQVELLLSIALCMGSYALADAMHMSGPIAAVVAGLFLGNHGWQLAMSEQTQEYLGKFWQLIDEILNSLLFLLMGLEIVAINNTGKYLVLGMMGIACMLIGRAISVLIPIRIMSFFVPFPKGTVALLTWGGLRGAISIALAFLLPLGHERELILTTTYVVVIFSILVQGLTFGPLLRKIVPPAQNN